ncbi:MAG: MerR family transcriptional regulator [Bryobacteraceae bacterium]
MVNAVRKANPPEIPDKLYFRIGEVSRLAGVKPYVLRYWETEFSGLNPKKSGSNHRLYRRKDVELILEIRRLLYEERFTIEGARNRLEGRGHASGSAPSPAPVAPPEPAPPTAVEAEAPVAAVAAAGAPAQATLFPPMQPALIEEIRSELREILAILS